ncbi:hypothetical protein COS81_02095 [candidate division WWE3 bacterium CG06_land_8_20_14_3_00_42_16]|uniref:Glycosyltransferase subfamily 4-like N-terminal domain-containing protein n=4 Tax=Katanobacteria TaxID=422282 RepID=A0A2M7ANG2_UNCKA|nr:MAG: hypothetical protein AUJ38_01160 [bacterium CG1_02_42_9]PIU68938.1 MAG: hypothetical protein COS81_02095 [candidate division WWE3 bacterium CG06_land_8_20_14_3_00_42_16]PJA37940.1 MAG: hypothetical protein CO181_01605 [candidate division WWE3 bacterium CG_4_9_14_3_um_filter_43_9]PJC68057.1 MAG: hypothetical protein CO015_05395 [candidate division WWE3 bacterium CG_4_8_14_3_um_filter_42_11]
MKILYLAPRFPYYPLKGDQLRDYNQIKLLSKKHEITLVTFQAADTKEEDIKYMQQYCRLELVFWNKIQSHLNVLRGSLSRLPLQVGYFASPAMSAKIKHLLKHNHYDLIHVHLARMAEYVKDHQGIPKVIDLMDAFSLNMRNRAKREKLLFKVVSKVEELRMKNYEKTLCQKFDKVIVVSERDRAALGIQENVSILPLGVDLRKPKKNKKYRHDLIFTGNMGYFPNQDAVLWFTKEVFPLILKKMPHLTFAIVGNNPGQKIKKLASKHIKVTGFVPSIYDYLAQARLAVAPLRSGSGMQIKVLEAMAAGCPVVATHYVSEGIAHASERKEIFIAPDDAQQFADKVVQVLQNNNLCQQVAKTALNLIEKEYTWNRVVSRLDRIYTESAGNDLLKTDSSKE